MFDPFFVDNLLYEHLAEVRRRTARQRLLGPSAPRPRRSRGLIRWLVQAVSIPALKRPIERKASR